MALALPASAADYSFRVEPGVAGPLTRPQSQLYEVGGGVSLKAQVAVTPWWDIGPAISMIALPASDETAEAGTMWGFGGGLRLHRPHDAVKAFGISPWIDGDFFFIRTGALSRPGFDVGAGLAVPLGKERRFWIGPFARYTQVLQMDRDGYDNRDAKLLTLGVSFEFGSPMKRHEVACGPAGSPESSFCSDRDGDGVPDTSDRCPDRAGSPDNFGCPVYRTIVVHEDRLELKEKLYFAWDKSDLEEVSFPVLDEVVEALNDNQGFRVQVEGHTDSTGPEAHNQVLSEARAQTVLDYLIAHGIAPERLVAKGFSSSEPTDTNTTAEGRENNRRVEFVVHFRIVK